MATPRRPVFFGLIFIGSAVLAFLVALGKFAPEARHAPPWVIAVCGLIFLLGGVFLIFCAGETPPSRLESILGGAMAIGLAIVAHWVAFGPGDRSGGASISLPFVSIGGRTGGLAIRIAFGFGAVLLDVLVVAAIVRAIKGARARRPEGPAGR